jgi:putative heme-binding domain-containing protein
LKRFILIILVICLHGAFIPCRGAQLSSEYTETDYRRYAQEHQGDADRGREIFFDEQQAACATCHSVDGSGSGPGPDLFAVGYKFDREELIEAVLEPSAELAVGYETTVVRTKAGKEHQGVLKQFSFDGSIELIGPNGAFRRIDVEDVAERRTSGTSLMPEGLQAGLSPDEFADLIAYLESLKQIDNLRGEYEGMPEYIPLIKQPVDLRPFHSEEHRFEHPVWFGQFPGEPNAYAVVEHETGRIWRLKKGQDGDRKTLFLDLGRDVIEGGTRGLLGMAFHPEFQENGRYFLALHIMEEGEPLNLTVERRATADLKRDSGRASRRLLVIHATSNVHYGGGLAFGPDGYLYIGTGDTGPQGDPNGHGQNTGILKAKMLRIDVDEPSEDKPYSIPPDNPFVADPDVLPEIWAYGFREPWRFSFDPVTGELWVGDVGQNKYEEIDLVRRSGNYGWNVMEGFVPFSEEYKREGETYLPPVFAYDRKYGPSVTGGHVYRGDERSSFYGVYVCGDFQSCRIWGLTHENGEMKRIRQLATSPQRIVSFGTDRRGRWHDRSSRPGDRGRRIQRDERHCQRQRPGRPVGRRCGTRSRPQTPAAETGHPAGNPRLGRDRRHLQQPARQFPDRVLTYVGTHRRPHQRPVSQPCPRRPDERPARRLDGRGDSRPGRDEQYATVRGWGRTRC